MSQSFIKKPDNGPHSALAGLGVLSTERPAADPANVLRRIVAWRDNVHAGRVVRGAELEALIEEGRHALGVPVVQAPRCDSTRYCAEWPNCNPACHIGKRAGTSPEGYMEAFYEMAALLGIQGAQAASPEQVYREQVKPALERLLQRAKDAEDAYLNMRAWAEQNGLDTTTRNGGVGGTGHQPFPRQTPVNGEAEK